MRKSLLLLATLIPLSGLAGIAALTLPAAAETESGSCATGAALDAGPLNLDAIPAKPVTGPLSVRGAGCGDDAESATDQGDGDHEGQGDNDD
jgi:hypothetical protein